MINKFAKLFLSTVNEIIETRGLVDKSDPASLKKVSVLISFLIFLLFSYPPFIVMTYIIDLKIISLVDSLSLIVISLSFYFYRKPSQFSLVSNIVNITIFIDLIVAYVGSGAGSSTGIAWIIFLPVIFLMLTSVRLSIILVAAMSVITLLVNIYQDATGIALVEVSKQSTQYFNYINTILTPFVFFLIALILHYSKESLIEELQINKKQLEASNENRKYLLSILFHDLANSLVVTKNYSSKRMNLDKDKDKLISNLSKINKASKNIEDIISHVKEFHSSEMKFSSLKLGPVSIESCFEKVLFVFDHRLKEKDITLKINSLVDEDVFVQADETSLCHSIFNNLISNAIKFSPRGSSVEVFYEIIDDKVHIKVKDQGIGISEDIKDELFDFDSFTTRNGTDGEKGTGFGLPIVMRYVKHFGGEIKALPNAPEAGTTFLLQLKVSS